MNSPGLSRLYCCAKLLMAGWSISISPTGVWDEFVGAITAY